VTLRATGKENTTYFLEILTWRDENIPDSAPPEIRAIWTEMRRLVETRDGRPGLSFTEAFIVTPPNASAR